VSRTLHHLVLLLPLLGAGCLGPNQQSLRDRNEATATAAEAVRAWEIVLDGEVRGRVIEFAELGGERGFHSVRNARHQELGMIDDLGRSWRYQPHADEPDWLGTGTVLEGARAILNLPESAEGFEVPLATLRKELN
jgi:hypothetical protein